METHRGLQYKYRCIVLIQSDLQEVQGVAVQSHSNREHDPDECLSLA